MDPRTGGTGSPYGYPFPLSPSAFAIHQQMAAQLDGRPMEPARYASPWEPSRLMGVSGGSPLLGDFGRLPLPDAATAAAAYRLNVWDMYRLQALRGMPIDPRGPLSPDFLARQAAGAPPTDMFGIHPASATPSIGLPFTAEGGSRLSTPRPESLSRIGRKRPLSLSPYAADFDLNTVIRMSPSSLLSGGNGSRCSSSASGTYGHLAASALSPSSLMALEHVRVQQQLQQYMQQAHAAQALFPSAFTLTGAGHTDDLSELHGKCSPKKDIGHAPPGGALQAVVSSSVPASPRRKEKVTRESAQSSTGGHEENDEDLMRSPPTRDEDLEAVETRCRWESCQLEFQCNSALVDHVNNGHLPTNKKQFVCRWTDCVREEKPFKAHYMLVVHMRRHTGEKPHRCKFSNCLKAYSRLENLKTHERSHTGDRPYVCEFPGCTKAFTNASDRAKHQNRTHSNLKPYMCKVPGCSKRYTDPSSLRKHIKTVHGPEYFGNKKHKGNDVPRRHRDDNDTGGLHPAYPRHLDDTRSSGKSGSGSEPSTPRGHVKQESVELSPSYSHPSSTFTNCSLDSPLSLTEFHHPSLSMPMRSNEPIAEVENEMDLDGSLAADIRAAIYGPDIMVPSPRMMPPQRRMALKPPPPPMASAGPVCLQDLNQRFTDMHTFPEPRPQYYTPTCERRDSTASIGTFYSSLPSDGTVASRRVSEASLMSPPYDPISVGSSRRSSEPTIVPNRSFYQQKIQMRQQQRWCPPNPAPPANGYHGMRRASEPTGMIAPQRIQPLTRRNLQRHNSTGAGVPNQEHLQISDEKIRYLEQLYEQTLAQGHGEDDDVGHDLPVVEQNYPPMSGYVQPPPMYQRSASFSYGHPNPAPEMPRRPSQPPEFYQTNVYQTATMQRQRRGGMARLPEMGGERRPLTEGSPDSYQVTSTTGMDPAYHVPPNGYEPAGLQGGESNMMMNDMNSLMSALDYENHLYKMVQ